jgi:hypothetical protein
MWKRGCQKNECAGWAVGSPRPSWRARSENTKLRGSRINTTYRVFQSDTWLKANSVQRGRSFTRWDTWKSQWKHNKGS